MSGRKKQSEAVSLYRPDTQSSLSAICFLISLFIHAAIGSAFVLSSLESSHTNITNTREAMQVDLVSFNPEVPEPPDQESSDAGEAIETGAQKKEPSEKSTEAEAFPVKKGAAKDVAKDYELTMPEPKVKESLKKNTFKPEKVISDAVNRMAEKSESSRPKSIEDRIARLKGEVGDENYKQRLSSRAVNQPGKASSDNFGPMEIYQAEVAVSMKQNWAFSRQMAGDGSRGLETRIVIKIMPSGEISEVWFEKRSGNDYLDESAYRTVMKANPLPALPEGMSSYHLVLGFTPSGLTP